MPDSIAIAVTEASQVGEARRAVVALARALGFDEKGCGEAALVATEIANNLAKHARDGVVILQPLEEAGSSGIEVLALDKGPGMTDPQGCLRDGFSTAGTPGTGLGAVVRLSAFVDLYSRPPAGTALVAILWAGATPVTTRRLRTGAVCVPKNGEEVCGDAWAAIEEGSRALLVVVDGLGHGIQAAEASRQAVRTLHENRRLGPAEMLRTAHAALRGTRGAAVAVAEADLDRREIRYAGVGNIAGSVLADGTSRSMVSHNGTVGHEARKFQEFVYPFPPGALLVMHSDGLATRWGLDAYPGLATYDPSLVAGVLYRDFQRGRDDATVVVARAAEEGA